MIIHEVWQNKTKPFGDTTMNIQVQLAQSENFRPAIPKHTEAQQWLVDLMQQCWKQAPGKC